MSAPRFGWCLHCERAFEIPEGMFLEDGIVALDEDQCWECPFDDCDGDVWDLWTWQEFREDLNNFYPDVPTHGCEYPMYPKSEGRAA